ncbi:cytochrome P450 [Amycolatopsis sp. NPDC059657]|uniref:cytochrome P450 n=1 Tax=Amycolatopsis sp. NPDC059657 TaxID=3346899 RepID=UPI00366FF58F
MNNPIHTAEDPAVYFDPLGEAFRADPFELYRRLLEEAPVHRGAMGAWFVTRYADVATLLRDGRLGKEFTQSSFFDELEAVTLQPRFLERAPEDPDKPFLLCDPPFHTRQRALLTQAFSPAVARGMQAEIDRIVGELLDEAERKPDFDVVADLGDPLPLKLLASLFGVPADEYDEYAALATTPAGALDVLQDQSPEAVAQRRAELEALQRYFLKLIERRRAEPGDDLITRLLNAAVEGDKLTDGEVVCAAIVLIVAAYGATKCFAANAFLMFARYPDQFDRLRANPELAESAVDEVSRFEPPVHAVGREATARIELDGHVIEPGDTVMPLIAAANRDPEKFEDPDVFDIGRANHKAQMGFGVGIHYCPGTVLSKPAGAALFRELAKRYRRIRLADAPLEYKPGFGLRGPERLHVIFDA